MLDDLCEAASALGFPLVAKLVNSESVTHKTELGAIVVGIKNQDELGAAVEKLLGIINAQDLREDGQAIPVLIQKMVQPAVEMFLGATVPVGDFPPMVLVGAGGIFVELMRDVSRVLAPTDQASALLAIERLKTYPLLTGYRGARKFDVQAVAQSLVKLGELIAATEEYVIDIDLNPLLVLPEGEGALIVDAVLALRTAGH